MPAKTNAQAAPPALFTPVEPGAVQRAPKASSPQMLALTAEITRLYADGKEGSVDLPGNKVHETLTLARRAAANANLGLDTGIKLHATGERIAPKNVTEDETMYRVSIAPRVKIEKPRKNAVAE